MAQRKYNEANESTIDEMIPSRDVEESVDITNDLLMYWDLSANEAKKTTVQKVIDAADITSQFNTGDVILARQSTAPTGWTQLTTTAYENAVIRLTTTVSVSPSTGGTNPFPAVHASFPIAPASITVPNVPMGISISPHTLTEPELPSHAHKFNVRLFASNILTSPSTSTPAPSGEAFEPGSPYNRTWETSETGSSPVTAHNHTYSTNHSHAATWSPTPIDMRIKYNDVIVIQKD